MTETKPEWVKMKAPELEKIVVDLHKQSNSPAKIGTILRDKYGVPKAKLISKKITKILKDAKLNIIPEKEIFSKKMKNLNIHIEKNKHDYTAKRSLGKKLWVMKKFESLDV